MDLIYKDTCTQLLAILNADKKFLAQNSEKMMWAGDWLKLNHQKQIIQYNNVNFVRILQIHEVEITIQ